MDYKRYSRHISLKEFGKRGQEALLKAKVLVVGAGGLGCPALQYLAAAGIGCIGIVDDDVVDMSNLQRQILYGAEDVGLAKVEVAAKKIKQINPEVQVDVYRLRLNNQNALSVIQKYDLVLDGSDNFETRYMVNDACVILNKVMVFGSVLRFEGQVAVFNKMDETSGIKTNYRDLFAEPNQQSNFLSCEENGVLGVLPGIIGTMQAAEVIKIISGVGKPLINKILHFNLLNNGFYEFELSPDLQNFKKYPTDEQAFLNFNYTTHCDHPKKVSDSI